MTGQLAINDQALDMTEAARATLRTVRDLGVRWLLDHIDSDGRPACSAERNGYYRLPWTLAFVGQREAASQVMSWIERQALTAEGDLRPGPAQEPWIEESATYPLSIIAQGAWALERYDTALATMTTLRSFQDQGSGGAYSERPEVRRSGRQFLFPTAQLGLAALTTGQVDMADRAFQWFTALYAAQTELPDRLFTAWAADGLAMPAPGGSSFMFVTDFRVPRQAFFNPGIGAAFLARYYMQSGDRAALDLARELLLLSANGTDDQFNFTESMQICKFGWGSATTLEVDPTGDHLGHVLRMTRWYADSQGTDGTWVPSPFLVPDPTDSNRMEKTAEHVLWVAMMLSSLSGGDQRGLVARR
jgi:hypothetical protein